MEFEEAVADVAELLLGEEWIVADAALGPGHGVEMCVHARWRVSRWDPNP